MSIFQDHEGVLWFGTIGAGVNKLDMGLLSFALYQNEPDDPNSLGDNMVRSFYEENNGDLWIGTMFGGIDRFNRVTGTWHHYRHDPDDLGSLSNDFVSAIYKDRSGVLWIGTASGLDRFNPETDSAFREGTFTHYQPDSDASPGSPGNNVRTIYEYQQDKFWIGTKGGLYQFDFQNENWSQPYRHNPGDSDSLSNDWVFTFFEDHQGRFWIGTLGGGLNLFDPDTETFTRYQNDPDDSNSLSNDIATGIFQDRNGILWIATAGGLDRFDPETETFTRFREKDGMANDSVYCVLEDRGRSLWVSTNKGLSRFDPQREIFKNYDMTDGLQSNEFNSNACLVSENGEMIFGGINGFNVFNPDNIQDNSAITPIVLTSLTHDGKEIDLGIAVDRITEVTFNWPDKSFEFEFAALSYAQPEKNQYAYYLDGFDEDWNEIGVRRYGKYTNLPSGTYTLLLKGSNNDGVWNDTGTALTITIVPPFWETWWFRGIALLALVGIAYGGFRMRIQNLESRGQELESLVEQRTAELMDTQERLRQRELDKAVTEERSRLARDLHDSVTQSLHSSTLMAEAGQRLAGSGDIVRARGYLVRLGEISQQALKEMRLLVYELRPLALSENGLAGALQQRLDAVERRAGVEVLLSLEENLELPTSIEEELYRIAMEALNNALKHANPTKVTVSLRKEKIRGMPCIELVIMDDGIGFDPDAKDDEGGLGLVSMKERIDKLDGELTILSTPGEGTQVKVCVDLKISENSPKAQEV
jgi:signal transduction histidine kinase/streptogramin lyase